MLLHVKQTTNIFAGILVLSIPEVLITHQLGILKRPKRPSSWGEKGVKR